MDATITGGRARRILYNGRSFQWKDQGTERYWTHGCLRPGCSTKKWFQQKRWWIRRRRKLWLERRWIPWRWILNQKAKTRNRRNEKVKYSDKPMDKSVGKNLLPITTAWHEYHPGTDPTSCSFRRLYSRWSVAKETPRKCNCLSIVPRVLTESYANNKIYFPFPIVSGPFSDSRHKKSTPTSRLF